MSGPEAVPEGTIWATRGRSWGFRFLLTAGVADPLEVYERVLAPIGDEQAGWCRVGEAVALRFPDPLGRRDAAGRVLPHDFVVFGDAAAGIESLDDGLQKVWPMVAAAYARVWDADGAPSAADLLPA